MTESASGLRHRARRRWLSIRRPWDKRFRLVDLVIALLVGLGLDWLLLIHHPRWADGLVTQRSSALFTAGAAVTGVLLGLTLTSLAILADYIAELTEPAPTSGTEPRQSQAPADAQQPAGDGAIVLSARHVKQLVGAFISATTYLGLATVLALAGLIPTGVTALKVFVGAWLVVTVIAVAAVARCTSLLGVVVRGIIERRARQKRR